MKVSRRNKLPSLYETMYRRLYEFYRDELSEQLFASLYVRLQTPIAVVNSEICVFF